MHILINGALKSEWVFTVGAAEATIAAKQITTFSDLRKLLQKKA